MYHIKDEPRRKAKTGEYLPKGMECEQALEQVDWVITNPMGGI